MTNDDRTVSRDELERLKQSGASPARAVLHIDGQMPHELVRRLVIGRELAHDDQVEAITLAGDPLVSKTHLAFDITSDGVVAIDLGSSNGTTITAGGTTCDVPTDAWTPVEAGASLTVGDTSIRVEFDASGHSGHVTPGMFTPPAAGIVTSVPGPAGAPTTTSCSSCGRQVVAGSRFCDGCGASTVAMAASAPPSSPPAVSGFPDGPVVTSPPPVATSWPGSAGAPQDLGRVTDDAVRVRSSSKRTMTIAAAGAVIVAVAAIGWLVLAGSDGDGPSATPLPRVADDVEELGGPADPEELLIKARSM